MRVGPSGQLIKQPRPTLQPTRRPRIPRTTMSPHPTPLTRGQRALLGGLPDFGQPPPPRPHPALTVERYQAMPRPERLRRFGFQGATMLDRQAAQQQQQIARQQRLAHYAHRIIYGQHTPQLASQLKAEQARDPHFQRDLNRVSAQTWNLAMARSRSTPLALGELSVEQLANPLEWGAGAIRGVGQVAHGHYLSGGLGIAGILPLGKAAKLAEVMRGARAVSETGRSAEEVTQHVLEASAKARSEGHGVLGPGIEHFRPGEVSPGTAGELGGKVRNALSGHHVPVEGMGPYESIGARLDAPSAAQARAEQEALARIERGRRAGAASGAFHASGGGLEGYYASLGQLRGELPKVNFDALKGLDQESVDALINHIGNHPNLQYYEKLRAQGAVAKMLGGQVPNRSEQLLLQRVFGKNAYDSLRAAVPLSKTQQAFRVLNVPRALMASMDLSAPFRQGLFAMAARPGLVARNLGPMIRAFGSEKTYQAFMQSIEESPIYPLMRKSGLVLTDIGEGSALTAREEPYMGGGLAERLNLREIPGPLRGKKWASGPGDIVRASDRAFSGLLNKVRADYFTQLVHTAATAGHDVNDEHVLTSIAKYVNSATGRGDLRALERHAVTLNTLLFSPRLLASRLNFLNPLYYRSLSPLARQEALRGARNLLLGMTATLGLAKLAGAKVGLDPRSADFAKIRIGNTRIDLAGGFQQPIRLAAELLTGEIISSTTGRKESLTSGGFGSLSRLDALLRFTESKEAPVAGLVTDMLRGKTFTGQPLSWKSELASHVTPLMLQDAYSMRTNPAAALGVAGLSGIGIGVQSYGPRDTRQQAMSKLVADSRKYGLPDPPPVIQQQAALEAHFNDLVGSGASYLDKARVAAQLFDQTYGTGHRIEDVIPKLPNEAAAQALYQELAPKLWGAANTWQADIDKVKSARAGQQAEPGYQPPAPHPAPHRAPAMTPSSYEVPAQAHPATHAASGRASYQPPPSPAAAQPVTYTPPVSPLPRWEPAASGISTHNPALDAVAEQALTALASGSYDPTEFLLAMSEAPVQSQVVAPSGQTVDFQVPTGSSKASQTARGAIALAQHYLGTPYVWGGESPGGFDCSGLLQYIYAKQGVAIPRTSQLQFKAGKAVPRGQLRPGDAVFFVGSDGTRSAPGHVGIYIGGGRFIDAPHSGSVVRVDKLSGFPGYVGARRYGR